MDILKTSTDWAKAELLSNGLFVLFGVMFVGASLLFWARDETDMARAFCDLYTRGRSADVGPRWRAVLWYVEKLGGLR